MNIPTNANKALKEQKELKRQTIFDMIERGCDKESIARFAGIQPVSVSYYVTEYKKEKGLISKSKKQKSVLTTKKINIFDKEKVRGFEFIIIDGKNGLITNVNDNSIKYAAAHEGDLITRVITIDDYSRMESRIQFK